MVKKNKKKKKNYVSTDVKDLGSQKLVQIDDKLYRMPDMVQMVMGLKHLYCKINSVLQNYYYRGQLDSRDTKRNLLRYLAGEKLEHLATYSGKTKSQTMNWDKLTGIPLGQELFNIQKFDAEMHFTDAMKSTKTYQSIIWDVIIDNKPCGRGPKMDKFREGLDMLIEHFDIK